VYIAAAITRHYGVFEDLFLFNGRFDAGKHFYDNAVIQSTDRPDWRF
jgi:hypothetical protein